MTPYTRRMTKLTGSNIRSSASVARIVELLTPDARETKTTLAASPPLATRTLLSPAPAIVARVARRSDGAPAARRKSHHLTALNISDRKFTPIARASRGSDAFRIECHADVQLMLRAKMIRKTTRTPVMTQRIERPILAFTSREV